MEDAVILIAEDDADDRYLMEIAFKEKGFNEKLHFVQNGIEVLSYLQHTLENNFANTPRIILLDLNMPKKDGREVLKELKQNNDFRKIPIIIFTTTKNEHEIKRCYDMGANTYIIKPVTFDALLETIEHIKRYWLDTASTAN